MTDYSTMPRQAGRRGVRKAPRNPELMLSKFQGATAGATVTSGDVTGGITAWGMDHNDTLECCGYAMADHYQVAKSGDVQQIDHLGGVGLALYYEYGVSQGETGTPPAPADEPDEGVDNPTWFTFLMDKGVIDAWAELDVTNVDGIHQAMLDFRGVCVAVELTDDAEQLFNEHEPWTVAQGESPDPNAGHDILLVKFNGEQGECFVTWGGLQWASVDWDADCIQNVYVFVSRDDAERTGTDIDALIAKIRELHGYVAPGAGPATPPPSPEPAPAPAPAPVTPPAPDSPTPPAPSPDTPPNPTPAPTFLTKLRDACRQLLAVIEEGIGE